MLPPAQPLPRGMSRQDSPGTVAGPGRGAQAGCLAVSTLPCSSVSPALHGAMGSRDPSQQPSLTACSPHSGQQSLLSGSMPLPWHHGPSPVHPRRHPELQGRGKWG